MNYSRLPPWRGLDPIASVDDALPVECATGFPGTSELPYPRSLPR